jgi:hypothetical protein
MCTRSSLTPLVSRTGRVPVGRGSVNSMRDAPPARSIAAGLLSPKSSTLCEMPPVSRTVHRMFALRVMSTGASPPVRVSRCTVPVLLIFGTAPLPLATVTR